MRETGRWRQQRPAARSPPAYHGAKYFWTNEPGRVQNSGYRLRGAAAAAADTLAAAVKISDFSSSSIWSSEEADQGTILYPNIQIAGIVQKCM